MSVTSSSLRAMGGAPLEGDRLVRLVYVDEAGISKPERFLVVLAVIVHADDHLIAIEEHLDELVARWIPPESQDNFVFHATEIFNGGGKIFKRDNPTWTLERRLKLADDLAAIPDRFHLTLVESWIDKSTFPASPDARAHHDSLTEGKRAVMGHVTAFLGCAALVDQWIRKNASNEVCMMIVEDNNEARSMLRGAQNYYQDKRIASLMDEERRKVFPLRRIKEDPLFQKKRKSSVLQVADFCAYVSRSILWGTITTIVSWIPCMLGFIRVSHLRRSNDLFEGSIERFWIFVNPDFARHVGCIRQEERHPMRKFQAVLAFAATTVALAGVAQSDDYRKITVTDIKLDQGHLDGVNVEVVGWIGSFGDYWLIQAKKRDTSSVNVDIQLLSRDERKVLLESCSLECRLLIRGYVSLVDYKTWGITAKAIEVLQ